MWTGWKAQCTGFCAMVDGQVRPSSIHCRKAVRSSVASGVLLPGGIRNSPEVRRGLIQQALFGLAGDRSGSALASLDGGLALPQVQSGCRAASMTGNAVFFEDGASFFGDGRGLR